MQDENATPESPRGWISEGGYRGGADRRIILVVGAPRSGTTWLASILNTYPEVIYSHEPFRKLGDVEPALLADMKRGILSREDKARLIRILSSGRPSWRRPPFFSKTDLDRPAILQYLCWYLVRITGGGHGAFCRIFSPDPDGSYDLLIKEVDWARHLESTIRALLAEVILIIRHPCSVVGSLIKGKRLGLMPEQDRHTWMRPRVEECRHLGYSSSSVLSMDDYEFHALDWLLQNLTYRRILRGHPRAAVIVYEELSSEPLVSAESLFRFLDWSIGPETQRFIELSTGLRHSVPSDLERVLNRYFGVIKDRIKVSESWKAVLSDEASGKVLAIASRYPDFRSFWSE